MNIYSKETPTKPDLDSYRDKIGMISVDDLLVEVKITNARLRFGHLDLLVTPVSGSGERWVEQHRVDVTV